MPTSAPNQASPEAPSQPPDIKVYTFVDLGCGKGRVVIIGSEFPFQDIVGIELSPELARIAQSNVAKIHRQFPGRPPIRIIAGNALDNLLTNGKIVFYLYNPFGRELMSQLVHKIESALLSTLEHVFIVYHNPVSGCLLDASPALRRWYAGSIAFNAADLDLWEDEHDSVVIWQSVRGARMGAPSRGQPRNRHRQPGKSGPRASVRSLEVSVDAACGAGDDGAYGQ
jgi:SAM-dependent methyltransferase